MTQAQLIASLRNKAKDERHARRMATDPAYRAEIEQRDRDYEEFIAKFGDPRDFYYDTPRQ